MLAKEILLTLIYLLLFNFLIFRFPKFQFRNLKPSITIILFNLKFLVGIFIWMVYTFYYKDVQNNDIHKFYNDALILRNVASESPKDFIQIISGIGSREERFEKYYSQMKNWRRNFDEAPFNENQTVIKFNALLMFISFRTYFVHILFMCFISLLGWILLTNAIMSFTDTRNSTLIMAVMLLPSVLFWTSGVMKEPLLVLGLGLLTSGLLNSTLRVSVRSLACFLTGFFIILLTKFFVVVCLIPALAGFLIFRKNEKTKFILAKYAFVNIALLLAAFNINSVVPNMNPEQMLANKQSNSIKEANYFNAGSKIEIRPVEATAPGIIEAIPSGIWNTIMRPYPWEGRNIMMLASALENIVIIILVLLCLWLTNLKSLKQINLILFLVNFSLAYFALIGICTPVLGNLVRYRAPILPFMLFAVLLNVKFEAIPVKFQGLLLHLWYS